MRVVTNASGRLETTGSWDDALATEAAQRARIAATRSEIRAMLEGNLQFHIDPLAAPVAPVSPPQPEPDGVIGYFRMLLDCGPNRTLGKVYPIVKKDGRIGGLNDDGSASVTWPADAWDAILRRGVAYGIVELCDKDGVKL